MKGLFIIFTIASLVFTTNAMAITTSEFLQKYGKMDVREFILKIASGTITADVNGELLIKHGRISTDYISAASVAKDFKRLGISAEQANKMIKDHFRDIEQENVKKIAEDKTRETYYRTLPPSQPPQAQNNTISRDHVKRSSVEKVDKPILVGSMTVPQNNAVRSAKNYIRVMGFSRSGLINQLSSDAGDRYDVYDATIAVDSLNINWNEQAVRSAKNYLKTMGFSCDGLINQLSSDAGDKYTESQATYGARMAGACQ